MFILYICLYKHLQVLNQISKHTKCTRHMLRLNLLICNTFEEIEFEPPYTSYG